MIWINLIAIFVSLVVMIRASSLYSESLMMPDPLPGALQFVGIFAIIVVVLGITALSVSEPW
jgi:hypothetical protein